MNEVVEISKANARKAYKAAPAEFKKVLSDLIGSEVLNEKITDRVDTFEDACRLCGYDAKEILPYANPKTSMQNALNGQAQAMVIAEALCEGWVPDYTNKNEVKYEARYIANSSGLGFSYYDYADWYSGTYVGARHVFPTAELAIYFGSHFIDIHNKYLTK